MAKLKFEIRFPGSICISVNFKLLLRAYHVSGTVLQAGGAKMEVHWPGDYSCVWDWAYGALTRLCCDICNNGRMHKLPLSKIAKAVHCS